TPGTITIPGTGETLTKLTPLSSSDVHNLLLSAQKFPTAFGSDSPLTSSSSSSSSSSMGTNNDADPTFSGDTSAVQSQVENAVAQEFGANQVAPMMAILQEES